MLLWTLQCRSWLFHTSCLRMLKLLLKPDALQALYLCNDTHCCMTIKGLLYNLVALQETLAATLRMHLGLLADKRCSRFTRVLQRDNAAVSRDPSCLQLQPSADLNSGVQCSDLLLQSC